VGLDGPHIALLVKAAGLDIALFGADNREALDVAGHITGHGTGGGDGGIVGGWLIHAQLQVRLLQEKVNGIGGQDVIASGLLVETE